MKLYQKCWILLKTLFKTRQCFFPIILFIAILVIIYLLVEIQVWLNDWNSDFFNALEKMDGKKLKDLVLWFIVVLAILVVITVNKSWLIKLLNISWRKWLTEYYLDNWFKDNQYYYYSIQHKNNRIDNPDQRIAEDIRMFVDKFLSLLLGFIQSFSMLITFIIILWNVSGTLEFELFNQQWKIKGYLVYCVFIFVFINSFVAHFIGKKIRQLNREKQRNEADFRSALIHQQEYAEDMVIYDYKAKHKKQIIALFYAIKDNWHRLMNNQRNLEYWQVFHQRVSSVIPLFLLIPVFVAGQINIGGLMKARQAFMLVSNNLSWFIFKYDDLAEFSAIIDRLYQFHFTIQEKNKKITESGEQIIVKNGTLLFPNSQIELLSNINLSLKPGEWLYIQGRSGIGKSTLLKTIMGLWPYAKGLFIKPNDIYMINQTPYIPEGTLAEVLSFPHNSCFSQEILIDILNKVNLSNLIPDLNNSIRWSNTLSSGEKQRIGLARVFLNKPKWLLFDEATTHLDELSAVTLLKLLKQSYPQMGVLFVSHQIKVAQQLTNNLYNFEVEQ